MAEAVVVPLLNKLKDAAVLEAAALAGVSNDIDILRDNLVWLQAIVNESSLHCRYDVKRLIRISHEAEDAVDQFLLQVDLSRFQHDWLRKSVEFVANFTTQILVRHRLAGKVAALNRRLEGIMENVVRFKVEPEAVAARAHATAAPILGGPQHWDGSYNRLVGRDVKKKSLLQLLLKDRRYVEIIFGESGVGKAAFVREVCRDREVEKNFALCAWASIPANSGVSTTVQLIYEKLFHECLSNSLLEGVDQHMPYSEDYKAKVREALRGQRYLLVLHGPISYGIFYAVANHLPNYGECKGDKFLLIKPSAWGIRNDYELGPLEDAAMEELFFSTVGIEKDTVHSSYDGLLLKYITGGLPLAVVHLAKLLRSKDSDQWEHVLGYIKSPNQQAARTMRILSISFDDLLDELKSCLLYFVGFLENTEINAHQLVRLWMAEGFLNTKNGTVEMERLGQDCLKELISRGFVLLIKKDAQGDVELVAIHSYVHAFLRGLAQSTCFMELHYGSFAHAPPNVRRLSLHNYNDKFKSSANRFSTLRSVICYGKKDLILQQEEDEDQLQDEPPVPSKTCCCMDFKHDPKSESSTNHSKLDIVQLLQGSRFLRVIDLEDLDIGNRLPKEIGNMVHLQHLAVRRCRSLQQVSESIGRLTYLQTFDVRGTAIRELPNPFWKIKALRHVLGDDILFPKLVDDNLELLHTLETVSVKDVDGSTFAVILRRNMSGLNSLHLIGLNESHRRALRDALSELSLLVRLRLKGEVIPLDFTWRSLLHLEYMQLEGRLEQLTEAYTHIDYNWQLTHLELKATHVKQDFIDMIAKLPVLAKLMLLTDSYDGEEFVFPPGGFKSLSLLRLSNIKVKKIVVKDQYALKKLDRLELISILQKEITFQAPKGSSVLEKIKLVKPLQIQQQVISYALKEIAVTGQGLELLTGGSIFEMIKLGKPLTIQEPFLSHALKGIAATGQGFGLSNFPVPKPKQKEEAATDLGSSTTRAKGGEANGKEAKGEEAGIPRPPLFIDKPPVLALAEGCATSGEKVDQAFNPDHQVENMD